MRTLLATVALALVLVLLVGDGFGQCPPSVPVEGAPPPGLLPLFPADNWWNTDVSAAPVDGNSASYIAFINNGGTRHLHPDFGGEVSSGSVDIYGMPYAIVDGNQPGQAVTFQYWDESDGVDYATGQGVPFYPIPAQAISEPHWIEGGSPGNVDQRSQEDRHLIIIDCANKYVYELYNVFYDTARAKWLAGSGAFFDLSTDNRRPDGWTSADAAGLAILPGLVRYDEAWNAAVSEIGHAFRVTVHATNGYVYPASHRAGSTAGALPMGARLRLKATVNGQDPALRTTDPNVQKVFQSACAGGARLAGASADEHQGRRLGERDRDAHLGRTRERRGGDAGQLEILARLGAVELGDPAGHDEQDLHGDDLVRSKERLGDDLRDVRRRHSNRDAHGHPALARRRNRPSTAEEADQARLPRSVAFRQNRVRERRKRPRAPPLPRRAAGRRRRARVRADRTAHP